ncbi:MAG TPA: hypothetical protein VEB61_06045 [Candidatus Binatia bacterium]|nr:hypothetical protein [Candidatus Binatia bacterium]
MAMTEGHFRKVWKQKGTIDTIDCPFKRNRGKLPDVFPADAPEMGSIHPIEARPAPAGGADHRS